MDLILRASRPSRLHWEVMPLSLREATSAPSYFKDADPRLAALGLPQLDAAFFLFEPLEIRSARQSIIHALQTPQAETAALTRVSVFWEVVLGRPASGAISFRARAWFDGVLNENARKRVRALSW
jgi:hypothetical protein